MSNQYTLICEYGGGTYISQTKARSAKSALLRWLSGSSSGEYLPNRARSRLAKELEENAAVAVEGCKNVWCWSASSAKGLILVHIVLTDAVGIGHKTV